MRAIHVNNLKDNFIAKAIYCTVSVYKNYKKQSKSDTQKQEKSSC